MDDTTTPPSGPAGEPNAGGPPTGGPTTGGSPAGGTGWTAPLQDGPRPLHTGALTDIHRTEDGRMVAGVCAGIGRYLGIDPVIPRIIFAVLTLVGFGGVVAYVAAWILLPDERTGSSYLKRWLSLGDNEPQIRLVGLGAAALIGISWTWGWGWPLGPLWIAAVAVIAWVAFREHQERKQRRAPAGAMPYAPAPWAPPPAAPGAPMPPAGSGAPTGAPMPPAPHGGPVAPAYAPPPRPAYAPVPPAPPRAYGPPAPMPPLPPQPPVPPPAPRAKEPKRPNPRHDRGMLTVLTLSMALIVTGVTLVATGGDLEPSVYVAVATGTLGLGMLVGTVFGNARPLILPAILAVLVLGVTTVLPRWDAGDIDARPATAAGVRDDYEVGVGQVVLDLRNVADPAALDGRLIDLEAGLGTVRVYVPATLDVDLDASVGAGQIQALGYGRGGVQTSLTTHTDTTRPDIALNIDVTIGDVEVIQP